MITLEAQNKAAAPRTPDLPPENKRLEDRPAQTRPTRLKCYTSKFLTFKALSSINWRRGSTTSPIKMVKI